LEAPGTYHHSILVANLAEVAAEQVGGNPVLARVAAYYHDIGKIKRPMFFKENQVGKENPHNKINPNLSTLIITSHVKDGLDIAKEYKLPKIIKDAIQQHHGTSLVKYFYVTARNTSDKPEEVKEEDFKYPGPIPETKEIAILMLADSVEAAVRSISEPTKGKIEEMVNNIIKARLNEGQLDNCDLTLKDLNIIRTSFLKALSGIYHQRIEYPTEK
jgi:putative nucleotidyltransferase with HDIG domain